MTHTFKLSRRTARLRATSVASLVSLFALSGGCNNADTLAPTAASDSPSPSFATTSASMISNLSASSGKTYRTGSGLAVGSTIYMDRSYQYGSSVPSAVAGAAFIQPANDDKDASPGSSSFLGFDLSAGAAVYVGHDNRLARPSWLTTNFQDTGLDLVSNDGLTKYSLFKKNYSAGHVTLGSNLASATSGDHSMYVVLVQATTTTTTTSDAYVTTTGSGIPFGLSSQPDSWFGSTYNGALRNIWPQYLLSELATIKSRGGKVVLALAGNEIYYKDSYGHFSLTKWKQRIDLFRNLNLGPYINDGTIIGNYLVDEPNDPSNWNGTTISGATLDEMARYSKSIWPNMVTIVRAYPDYLAKYTGTYYYLDAAWAQYVYRKGDVSTFIANNVSLAKSKGLALVVGLNVTRGGPDAVPMTADQVKSWGSVLLNNSYPCTFISWQYDDYLTRSDIKSAMAYLRSKADAHVTKSCRGS